MCEVLIPAGRPAERHTAVDADVAALCGVARCFPVVSGDVVPRG